MTAFMKYSHGNRLNNIREISGFVVVASFAIFTFAFGSYGCDLHISSQEEMEIYSEVCSGNVIDTIRSQNIIDYENPVVTDAIEEISRDPIGSELLRLLSVKIKMCREIYRSPLISIIIRDCSKDEYSEDYSFDSIVNINFDNYHPNGNHLNMKYSLIGLTKNMRFKIKRFNLADTIFHELTHVLHLLEDGDEMWNRTDTLKRLVESGLYTNIVKELYTDDEEFRTISGIYMKDGMLYRDLISEYYYDLYKNGNKSTGFLSRIFHATYDDDLDALVPLEERAKLDYFKN